LRSAAIRRVGMVVNFVSISKTLATTLLQEVAELRSAVVALQEEKAALSTQLGDRVDELMEVTEQLEAEKAAAELREAELQKVRGGVVDGILLIFSLSGAHQVTLRQTHIVPHWVSRLMETSFVRDDFETEKS